MSQPRGTISIAPAVSASSHNQHVLPTKEN